MKRTLRNLAILMLLVTAAAFANPLTILGSQADLSFSALFENLGGGLLQITLSNTSQGAPLNENGVIGALFFNVSGNPTLTPVSMLLGAGSTVVNGSGDPSPNWRYDAGLSGPGGANKGISAAGYGLFGSHGNFCSGQNCGSLLHGIDWGLVNTAYIAGSGNGSIAGEPMIRNTAVFVLSGISLSFDPSIDVNSVSAQFTATLTTPSNVAALDPPGVPEPSTYCLVGTGIIIASLIRRRRVSGAKQ